MRDLEDPTQFGNANRSQVEIRQATEDDASAILALHQESINDQDLPHEQKAMGLDVPADLEHFSATYIGSIHNRFWVAVAPQRETATSALRERVIGMVGVVATKTDVAEMRPASSDAKLPPPRHCRTFAAGGFGPLPGSRILEGPVGRPA